MSARDTHCVGTVEMRCLKAMCGITTYGRVRNDRIRVNRVKVGVMRKSGIGHPQIVWQCYVNGGRWICMNDSRKWHATVRAIPIKAKTCHTDKVKLRL